MLNRIRRIPRGEWLRTVGFVVSVNAVGAFPAFFFGADTEWFDRPWFFPPEILFPIVWTALFTLLGIALSLVWRRGRSRNDIRLALALFGIQFLLNLAWTPVFFGLRRPDLGLVVIGLLWVSVVSTIVAFDRVDRRAAALLVPYLAWISFAGVLNYAIYAA